MNATTLKSTNRYFLTLRMSNIDEGSLVERKSIRLFLKMARRQNTILFGFTSGGVLRRGYYVNGIEQPLHLHFTFSSVNELFGKERFCSVRNETTLITPTMEKFTSRNTNIHMVRALDTGADDYCISPVRNPDYFGVVGDHFCPSRKECPICSEVLA